VHEMLGKMYYWLNYISKSEYSIGFEEKSQIFEKHLLSKRKRIPF